jgi:hypothetical protein
MKHYSSEAKLRIDRAHWLSFGDSALVFVVYIVLTDDYNTYMDIQQAITLGIIERLRAEEIPVAYGTSLTQVPPEFAGGTKVPKTAAEAAH